MPAPLIWLGATAAGSLIGSIVGQGVGVVSSVYISPAIKPTERTNIYAANLWRPNLMPPVEQLVHAHYFGFLNDQVFEYCMGANGVNMNDTNPLQPQTWSGIAWDSVIKASAPKIDPAILMTAKAFGTITPDDLSKQLKSNGFFKQEYIDAFMARQFCPDYRSAYALHGAGMITQDDLDTIAKRLGMFREEDKENVRKFSELPGVGAAFELYNREIYTAQELSETLFGNGFFNAVVSHGMVKLADAQRIPPVQDLVRFAVKEVFSPDVAFDLGLFDEFPSQIEPYAKLLGMGRKEYEVGDVAHGPIQKSAMELYWAAHWQPLAPTQAYEMLHRIREDNVNDLRAQGFNVNPFTIEDVRRWLRIADYPPAVRDYLAAISYRPLRLFDIRNLIDRKLITEEKAISLYRDLGYSPENASTLVRLAKSNADKKRLAYIEQTMSGLGRRTVKTINGLFSSRLINRENATARLTYAGFEYADAANLVSQWEAEWLESASKDSIKSVKSSYMMGAINDLQTVQALQSIGIILDGIDDYMRRWRLQRTLPRRMATADKITTWYVQGLLTNEQAVLRLTNIGVNQADIMLAMAEAVKKKEQNAAKMQVAATKTRSAQVKELEKVQKQIQQQNASIQSRIRALTPVSTLVSWLKKGIITDDEFVERMKKAGAPDDAILRYWQSAVGGPNPSTPSVNGTQKPKET